MPVKHREHNFQEHTLAVSASTVQLHCALPIGMSPRSAGSYVRFPRRGISISLPPSEIVQHCFIGLHSPLAEGTRPYLARYGGQWCVQLGLLSVEVTEAEAEDLCSCMDLAGQAYLDALIESSSLLDVSNYPAIDHKGLHGVALLSVPARVWQAMLDVANEFEQENGNSAWHIFDCRGSQLAIRRLPPNKMRRYPQAVLSPLREDAFLSDNSITLVYEYPDLSCSVFEQHEHRSWQEEVGEAGFWTASMTCTWLVERFIPFVCAHSRIASSPAYQLRLRERLAIWLAKDLLAETTDPPMSSSSPLFHHLRDTRHMPLDATADVKHLLPYLEDLQQWFNTCPVSRLSTDLIRPYYQTLTEVSRQLDVTLLEEDHSLWNYLLGGFSDEEEVDRNLGERPHTYEQALRVLHLHLQRVSHQPFESSFQCDALSCAFLWILRNAQGDCPHPYLRAAAQALAPLWNLYRFTTSFRRSW